MSSSTIFFESWQIARNRTIEAWLDGRVPSKTLIRVIETTKEIKQIKW